ncbi:MAG: NADH-quinone oxidoreductase subunit NuoH [candidate division Zixibacteria bacterium]
MELKPVFDWLGELLVSIGLSPYWNAIIKNAVLALVVFGLLSLIALFLVWWERKVSAHIQQRYGPMMTGWHGVLQTIADALKLIQKEDLTPTLADRSVFFWAPVICFVSAFAAYVVIPFGDGLIVSDLNIGILYIIAITTFTIIALLMAGWGSNNKYALLGGMRSAAQAVSYEVPLALSILGVVMVTGSMSMNDIVVAQSGWGGFRWNIFFQPLGFVIYIIAATAEANRTPFDIPEAEQELVAGFNIEYSGMKFAMFFLAEFINMFTVSAIAATVFLGGWNGPFFPSWMWFLGKTLFVVFLLMLFRWTYPRVRVDQLMEFAWKVLLPLAFLNILWVGILEWLSW